MLTNFDERFMHVFATILSEFGFLFKNQSFIKKVALTAYDLLIDFNIDRGKAAFIKDAQN